MGSCEMKTSEHWRKVEELFHAALKLEPDRRAVFLSEACSREPELLAEIQSMIAAHEAEGSFIDSPAFEGTTVLTDSTQAESRIGKSVGHYNLVASLGKGGMGEVYLAEDSSLRRKVAIKFLTTETVSDDKARKRL